MNEHLPRNEMAQRGSTISFDRAIANAARICIVVLTILALCAVLIMGKEIFAPAVLAIVIGLMFGPLEDWLETRKIPSTLSAAVVVLLFMGVIAISVYFFAAPVSEWIARGPQIWAKLQEQVANFREPLAALTAFQEQLNTLGGSGDGAVPVTVNGGGILEAAMHAPSMAAEALVFLASLYFYVATRRQIRQAVLAACRSPRLRWRLAHVFREIEHRISRFLLTVTVLNLATGAATAAAMFAIGMPSPLLWGALAFALNYIPYVGQGVMIVLLLVAGAGTQDGLVNILLPLASYLVITFAEGQIITPHVLGHRMTMNPFLIFLSTALGLWAWGPIGGAISVPTLLILQAVLAHVVPQPDREVHEAQKKLTAAIFRRNATEDQAENDVPATDTGGGVVAR